MAQWLENLRVWDGIGDVLPARISRIGLEGDAIVAVEEQPRADLQGIDLRGCTALPGLIDAHVHLGLDPKIRLPADQLALDSGTLEAGMRRRAGAMLAAGITTARDLGGAQWREIELASRIERREVFGPRLLCAGQPVTSVAGHCHFWGGEAANSEQIREVVRRQVAHGSHWIKVMATGGVITKGTQPMQPQFSASELGALVDEARAHGRSVAAHCHGTEGIRLAAHAGVRTVEHCSFAGQSGFGGDFQPSVVEAIAAAGAWVSPTVNAGWSRFIEHKGRPTGFLTKMRHCLSTLVRAGVPLIASTDAGIPGVEHHRLAQALAVLPHFSGLRPVEVLRSATSESARALSLAHCGRLAPGMCADILVVEGNPLEDLRALERVRMVVTRGRVLSGEELAGLRLGDRSADAERLPAAKSARASGS